MLLAFARLTCEPVTAMSYGTDLICRVLRWASFGEQLKTRRPSIQYTSVPSGHCYDVRWSKQAKKSAVAVCSGFSSRQHFLSATCQCDTQEVSVASLLVEVIASTTAAVAYGF